MLFKYVLHQLFNFTTTSNALCVFSKLIYFSFQSLIGLGTSFKYFVCQFKTLMLWFHVEIQTTESCAVEDPYFLFANEDFVLVLHVLLWPLLLLTWDWLTCTVFSIFKLPRYEFCRVSNVKEEHICCTPSTDLNLLMSICDFPDDIQSNFTFHLV